jgi:hypothetical protein
LACFNVHESLSNKIILTAAAQYRAAVSVRRTVFPIVIGLKPVFVKRLTSCPEKPPSGPIANAKIEGTVLR